MPVCPVGIVVVLFVAFKPELRSLRLLSGADSTRLSYNAVSGVQTFKFDWNYTQYVRSYTYIDCSFKASKNVHYSRFWFEKQIGVYIIYNI